MKKQQLTEEFQRMQKLAGINEWQFRTSSMGTKGEEYIISKSGSKDNPTYVLEKPDGSEQLDMFFDNEEQAKKYAKKKGLIIKESTDDDNKNIDVSSIYVLVDGELTFKENEYEYEPNDPNLPLVRGIDNIIKKGYLKASVKKELNLKESNIYTKSSLKSKIKEMVLKEIEDYERESRKIEYGVGSDPEVGDLLNKASEYVASEGDTTPEELAQVLDISVETAKDLIDMLTVDEAKKEEPEEETETEETEIETSDEGTLTTPQEVQKELMQALEASKKLGDKKLVRQIGNALTYFTRTQISSDEEMA